MGDNNNAFAAQMLHSGKLIRKLRIEKNVAASIGGALLYAEVQYLKLEAGSLIQTFLPCTKFPSCWKSPLTNSFN